MPALFKQSCKKDDFVPTFNGPAADETTFFLLCRIINVICIVEKVAVQVDRASSWFLVLAAKPVARRNRVLPQIPVFLYFGSPEAI